MRSRPDLSVYLSPQRPCPGERLRARVVLTSRTETPFDRVDVALIGKESRYKNSSSNGQTTTSHYHRRDIVRLGGRFDGGVLQPGVWERTVTFDIPHDAPPSYKSPLASIEYALEVRVHIPWWPDRRERYTLAVDVHPVAPSAPQPQLFTTQAGDHRGDEPVLELSLEDNRLPLGGSLAGAVAITGLGSSTRLRRVEVACVAVENALVKSSAGPRQADARTWTVHKGTPGEGASLPFRLAIPADLPPTFQTPFIRVEHFIEARGVVAFGSDITLRVPAVALRAERAHERAVAPLVGSARHATVWQAALQHLERVGLPGLQSLRFDPAAGVASFRCHGVAVELAEESGEVRERASRRGLVSGGGDTGPCLTAELTWPDLGLELRVAERRWTDFGHAHAALDEALQRRFSVRAREPAQAASMLTAPLRDALSAFDEAGLDDARAVVLRRGGVYKPEGLVRFVTQVHHLATQLHEHVGRVGAPAALAPQAAAWRELAHARGARLRPGDLALLDWSLRGVPLTLTHTWAGAQATGSELRTSLPSGADAKAWTAALGKAVGGAGFAEPGLAGAALPELARPDTLMPLADAFSLAVVTLLGADVGPYR